MTDDLDAIGHELQCRVGIYWVHRIGAAELAFESLLDDPAGSNR